MKHTRIRPRIELTALKHHNFRSKGKQEINVKMINTKLEDADILTEELVEPKFILLRTLVSGLYVLDILLTSTC